MKIEELIPKIERTDEFSFSKQKVIPKEYGCYVISNFNFKILYIGKATKLLQRFNTHLDTPEKNELTILGKAYWFSFRLCKDEFEIAKLERGWLNQFELKEGELPILNKIRA